MLGEFFDPKAELFINNRLRPHWSQDGAIVFVTFRTKDSIPKDVLARWEREKQEWAERVVGASRGSLRDPKCIPSSGDTIPVDTVPVEVISIDEREDRALDRGAIHNNRHWSELLPLMTGAEREHFQNHFYRCRERKLVECLGQCVLKNPELAKIVADSLMYFDGDRYQMGDFVVMPNHVHLLAAFPNSDVMEQQFDSWLHYTAVQINKHLNTKGHFWQQEPFDHLVRSPDYYDFLRTYIANNPIKAGLKPGEFYYRRLDD